jgi:hypothetical protein
MRESILNPDFWLLATQGLGAVAQLGERLICTQEVAGSIPTSSTRRVKRSARAGRDKPGRAQARNRWPGPVAQMARAHP